MNSRLETLRNQFTEASSRWKWNEPTMQRKFKEVVLQQKYMPTRWKARNKENSASSSRSREMVPNGDHDQTNTAESEEIVEHEEENNECSPLAGRVRPRSRRVVDSSDEEEEALTDAPLAKAADTSDCFATDEVASIAAAMESVAIHDGIETDAMEGTAGENGERADELANLLKGCQFVDDDDDDGPQGPILNHYDACTVGGELELAGSVHSDEAEEGDELLEGEGAIESEPEDGDTLGSEDDEDDYDDADEEDLSFVVQDDEDEDAYGHAEGGRDWEAEDEEEEEEEEEEDFDGEERDSTDDGVCEVIDEGASSPHAVVPVARGRRSMLMTTARPGVSLITALENVSDESDESESESVGVRRGGASGVRRRRIVVDSSSEEDNDSELDGTVEGFVTDEDDDVHSCSSLDDSILSDDDEDEDATKQSDSDSDVFTDANESFTDCVTPPAPVVEPRTPPATPAYTTDNALPAWTQPTPKGTATPSAAIRAFARTREVEARALYAQYNHTVFGGALPASLSIVWNKKLNKTAGQAKLRRRLDVYSASIELSTKVIDAREKLQNTLCHEMCHVAAWLINHSSKPPHGPLFKTWAARAMRHYPHLSIATCHSYDIAYKYQYQCGGCLKIFPRHSKSINVERQGCPCGGRLTLLPSLNADGSVRKSRPPNAFALYMKEHMGELKRAHPGMPQGEVMKMMSAQYKAQKNQ